MDDIRAVLDAVGVERAVLVGSGAGGQPCAMFAATYPERTRALVLVNTPARAVKTEDYRVWRKPGAPSVSVVGGATSVLWRRRGPVEASPRPSEPRP
jgi:pimeloyl-ACP methyl ester carboxylesterase